MKKNLMLCALLLSVLFSGCAAEPLQGQAAANTTEASTLQEGTPDSFEPVWMIMPSNFLTGMKV